MTKINQIYKCQICGNIVEMVHAGDGELVCCGEPMVLYTENTVDAATEKHIPIITRKGNKLKVTVGETLHPMTEDHFIQWIEVITKDQVFRKKLSPEDAPQAQFEIDSEIISVRAYCNLHGLWVSK